MLVDKDEVTIMYSYRVNTLFYVIYTFPAESILTGELEEEYVVPDESSSWKDRTQLPEFVVLA